MSNLIAEDRLLSFGLRPEHSEKDKDGGGLQRIINISITRRLMYIISREEVDETYSFDQIKKVRKDERNEAGFSFFCGGAVTLYLECENDRDDVVTVLDMVRENDTKNVHHKVGATKIFDGLVKKRGRIRWAERYVVHVKGRLLVFRSPTSQYPINAISLTEGIPKSGKETRELILSTLFRDFRFQFESKDLAFTWTQVLTEAAKKCQATQKEKQENRSKRSDQIEALNQRREARLQEKMHKEKREREELEEKFREAAAVHSSDEEDDSLAPPPPKEFVFQMPTHKAVYAKRIANDPLEWDEQMDLNGKTFIFSWGEGADYQLGTGQTHSLDLPRKQAALERKMIEIDCSMGGTTVFGCDLKGRVYAWGTGPLGLGEKQYYSASPYQMIALRQIEIARIACSEYHTLCLSKKGNVYACGIKYLTGFADTCYSPRKLPLFAGHKIVGISANQNHSLAWSREGVLFAWGRPGAWLGLGDSPSQSLETSCCSGIVRIGAGLKVRHASAGEKHSAIVTGNGQLYTFGEGDFGQLGLGDTHARSSPSLVSTLDNVPIARVACANEHTVALSKDGKVYTFGCGREHQLGHGNTADQLVPKLVFSLAKAKVVRVYAGPTRTMAISSSGVLLMWGFDPSQPRRALPNPNPITRPEAAFYLGGYRVYDVALADTHCLALCTEPTSPIEQPVIAKVGARDVAELQERLAASGVMHELGDNNDIERDFHVDQESGYYANGEQFLDDGIGPIEDEITVESNAIASFGITQDRAAGSNNPFLNALAGSKTFVRVPAPSQASTTRGGPGSVSHGSRRSRQVNERGADPFGARQLQPQAINFAEFQMAPPPEDDDDGGDFIPPPPSGAPQYVPPPPSGGGGGPQFVPPPPSGGGPQFVPPSQFSGGGGGGGGPQFVPPPPSGGGPQFVPPPPSGGGPQFVPPPPSGGGGGGPQFVPPPPQNNGYQQQPPAGRVQNFTVLLSNGSPLGQILMNTSQNLAQARQIIDEELDFVPPSYCFLKNNAIVGNESSESLSSFAQSGIVIHGN